MGSNPLDVFAEIDPTTLARSMEEAENVMRYLRRMGDDGIWFAADFCGYHYDHPEIMFSPEDRPEGARAKDVVACLASAYGCSSRSIYNWIAIGKRWPDKDRRGQASPTIFIQALVTDDPDTWVDMAIENGWSTREMLRAWKEECGEETMGDPIEADVTARRYTDEFGKHHLDLEPDPAGLFGFDCRGEHYKLRLREVRGK